MKTNQENLIPSGTVSLAASANLEPFFMGQSVVATVQLVWTGTPAGNFKLQGSCDKGNFNAQARSSTSQQAGVSNWSDIASPAAVTVSAAGNQLFNLSDVGYHWVRVVWTATGAGSGTPTLTVAQVVTKGI